MLPIACWTLDKPMASLSTCHLGLWLGWQLLLNLLLNLVNYLRHLLYFYSFHWPVACVGSRKGEAKWEAKGEAKAKGKQKTSHPLVYIIYHAQQVTYGNNIYYFIFKSKVTRPNAPPL